MPYLKTADICLHRRICFKVHSNIVDSIVVPLRQAPCHRKRPTTSIDYNISNLYGIQVNHSKCLADTHSNTSARRIALIYHLCRRSGVESIKSYGSKPHQYRIIHIEKRLNLPGIEKWQVAGSVGPCIHIKITRWRRRIHHAGIHADGRCRTAGYGRAAVVKSIPYTPCCSRYRVTYQYFVVCVIDHQGIPQTEEDCVGTEIIALARQRSERLDSSRRTIAEGPAPIICQAAGVKYRLGNLPPECSGCQNKHQNQYVLKSTH